MSSIQGLVLIIILAQSVYCPDKAPLVQRLLERYEGQFILGMLSLKMSRQINTDFAMKLKLSFITRKQDEFKTGRNGDGVMWNYDLGEPQMQESLFAAIKNQLETIVRQKPFFLLGSEVFGDQYRDDGSFFKA